MAVAKKAKQKTGSATQGSFRSNVARKQNLNRQRYENGEISLGSLRSLNAAVTTAARRKGMIG